MSALEESGGEAAELAATMLNRMLELGAVLSIRPLLN